ncbi:MAG: hypothetical protein IJZ25_04865, partial [Lachnospiraceae bacterium]|nr:hypothetical protein [Lachnospiraceae bacterium]
MKLKLKFRRVVSFILTLCMVASMLSHFGPVFAQAAEVDAVDASDYLGTKTIYCNGTQYYGYNPATFNDATLISPNEDEMSMTIGFSNLPAEANVFKYAVPTGMIVSDGLAGDLIQSGKDIGDYYFESNVLYMVFDNYATTKTVSLADIPFTWDMSVIEGRGSHVIDWRSRFNNTITVYFKNSYFTISKAAIKDENYDYSLDSVNRGGFAPLRLNDAKYGNALYQEYTITLTADADAVDTSITGITVRDALSIWARYAEGGYATGDVCVKTYKVGNSKTSENYYEFTLQNDYDFTSNTDSDNVKVILDEENNKLYISGLTIEDQGKVEISYYVVIPEDMRPKIDAYADRNSGATITNTATGIQSVTYSDNTTDYIYTRTNNKVSYYATAGWLVKESEAENDGQISNGVITIPYTIELNNLAEYSLGGSMLYDRIIIHDSIEPLYDTNSGSSYVTRSSSVNGESEISLTWVELNFSDFSTLVEYFIPGTYIEDSEEEYAGGVQLDVLFGNAELLAILNTATGKTLTKSTISNYVFYVEGVDVGENPSFVWFMPEDANTEISTYEFNYNVCVDEGEVFLVNRAYIWYDEYESDEMEVWSNEDTFHKKTNSGVYSDSDGNLYVDWEIEINVEEDNTGFNNVLVQDTLPHKTILGVTYVDWIPALKEADMDYSSFLSSAIDETVKTNSEQIFNISTDSTDPEVQEAVEQILGVVTSEDRFGWYNDKRWYSGCSSHAAVVGDVYYSGDNLDAGQFTADTDVGLEIKEGYTWSPEGFIFLLDDIPATEEAYTITIKYTTQVNPELVKYVENASNISDILMTNYVRANHALPYASYDWYLYSGNNEESGGIGSRVSSSYILSVDELEPFIHKTGDFDGLNLEFDYEVVLDGNKVEVDTTSYVIEDNLSIAGIQYLENSFVIEDATGKIIYASDSSKIHADYKDSGISVSIKNSTNGYSTYSVNIPTNDGSVFVDDNGMLAEMNISYSVEADLNLIPEGTPLVNYVKVKARDNDVDSYDTIILDMAKVELYCDSPVEKILVSEPTYENEYVAGYMISVNLDSPYVDDYLAGVEPGDTIVVSDVLDKNLSLDRSIKFVYEAIDDETELPVNGFDPKLKVATDSLSFTVTFEVIEGVSRYNIFYSASVLGNDGSMINTINTARIEGSEDAVAVCEESFYKVKPSASATTTNINIQVVKETEEDSDNTIDDVKFVLEKYVDGAWVEIVPDDNSKKTTSEGYIEINNGWLSSELLLSESTWFRLIETETVAPYTLDTEPKYFYIKSSSSGNPVASSAPAEVKNDAGIIVEDYLPISYKSGTYGLSVTNGLLDLEIAKTDAEAGTPVYGAEFTLYSNAACTNVVATSEELETDASVSVFKDIELNNPTGTTYYYIKETGVPDNYAGDSTVYKVTVVNNQVTDIVSVDGTKTLTLEQEGSVVRVTSFPNTATIGELKVTKTVENGNATSNSYPFEFKLTLRSTVNNATLAGNYPYVIYNANGTSSKSGNIANGGTFNLSNGQYIVISKLPEGTKYTVTETRVT